MRFRSNVVLAAAAATLLLASAALAAKPESPGGGRGGPPACDEAAVAAAVASIDAACPCAGQTDESGAVVPWKNHGKYVRCVAHATKAAVKGSDGALTRRCLRSSIRCAARSTCGRAEGVVNCTVTSSSACVAGSCDDGRTCSSDDDCTRSSCSFRPSADQCTADGGVAGTGSCCAPALVGSPSGAFLDQGVFF